MNKGYFSFSTKSSMKNYKWMPSKYGHGKILIDSNVPFQVYKKQVGSALEFHSDFKNLKITASKYNHLPPEMKSPNRFLLK